LGEKDRHGEGVRERDKLFFSKSKKEIYFPKTIQSLQEVFFFE
jgi:hypothetical protein